MLAEPRVAHVLGQPAGISALGGAAITLPLSARAQQPERMRRIGVLFGFDKNDPEAEEYSRAMLRTAVAEC